MKKVQETASKLKSGSPEYKDILERLNNEIGLTKSGFQVMQADIFYKRNPDSPHAIRALLNLRAGIRTFVTVVKWRKNSGYSAQYVIVTSNNDDKIRIKKQIASKHAEDFAKLLVQMRKVADIQSRKKMKVTASALSPIKTNLEKFKFTVVDDGETLTATHNSGEHIKVFAKMVSRETDSGDQETVYRIEINAPLFPDAPDKYYIKAEAEDPSASAAFQAWYPLAIESFNKIKKAWAKDVNGDIGRGYYWLTGFFAKKFNGGGKKKGKGRKPAFLKTRRKRGRRRSRASVETAAGRSIKRFSSGVYFHYTLADRALSILSNNVLKLVPSLYSNAEKEKTSDPFSYFASFARTPLSSYIVESTGVIFVLDAKKLKERYKIKPVDYWNSNWVGYRKYGNRSLEHTRESEDRLYSKNKEISLPDSFIKEIHISIPIGSKTREEAVKLYTIAKKRKIPVYIHKNNKTFVLMSDRSSDHQSALDVRNQISENIKRNPTARNSLYLKSVLNIYNAKKYSDLKPYATKLGYSMYPQRHSRIEFKSVISSDIRESKNADEKLQNQAHKVVSIMRKHKADFEELHDIILEKFQKLAQEDRDS